MHNVPLREPFLDVFESVDPLLHIQRHDDAPFSQREGVGALGAVERNAGEVRGQSGLRSPDSVPCVTDVGQPDTQSIALLMQRFGSLPPVFRHPLSPIQYPVNAWPASLSLTKHSLAGKALGKIGDERQGVPSSITPWWW